MPTLHIHKAVQNNGVTGAVNASIAIEMTMVSFLAISLYNVIVLNIIIFATFTRREGVYFWSFIFATWDIAPYAIGFALKYFDINVVWWVSYILVSVGWWVMVIGQSMVLYSGLHLIVQGAPMLWWVHCIIIFDAVWIGILDTCLAWLSGRPDAPLSIINIFLTFDKVQVVVFCVQESIISALYIYKTVQLL